MTELQRQRLQVARMQLVKLAEELAGEPERRALNSAVQILDDSMPPTGHETLCRLTGTSA